MGWSYPCECWRAQPAAFDGYCPANLSSLGRDPSHRYDTDGKSHRGQLNAAASSSKGEELYKLYGSLVERQTLSKRRAKHVLKIADELIKASKAMLALKAADKLTTDLRVEVTVSRHHGIDTACKDLCRIIPVVAGTLQQVDVKEYEVPAIRRIVNDVGEACESLTVTVEKEYRKTETTKWDIAERLSTALLLLGASARLLGKGYTRNQNCSFTNFPSQIVDRIRRTPGWNSDLIKRNIIIFTDTPKQATDIDLEFPQLPIGDDVSEVVEAKHCLEQAIAEWKPGDEDAAKNVANRAASYLCIFHVRNRTVASAWQPHR